nr:DUF2303 family protein [Novosphingobium sp. FKTRR1]
MEPFPEKWFDAFREAPKRRQGTAILTRVDSLIDHVNRFRTADTALFAADSKDRPSLVAVIDYHPALNWESVTPDGDIGTMSVPQARPGWQGHKARFDFPLSEEWKAWVKFNGKLLNNVEFSEFLEDRFIDVLHVNDPAELNDDIRKLLGTVGFSGLATPTSLYDLSGGLTIAENVVVGGHHKLQNGATEIQLRTEQSGAVNARGENITVPSLFIIEIPVFANSQDVYRIAVRLRTRTAGGLHFKYELWGLDRVLTHAFEDGCNTVAEATNCPLFYGTPE